MTLYRRMDCRGLRPRNDAALLFTVCKPTCFARATLAYLATEHTEKTIHCNAGLPPAWILPPSPALECFSPVACLFNHFSAF